VPAAIVFAAAALEPTPRLRARLAALPNAFVVAADGGAATALAFDFTPDVLIGDFDSLEPDVLTRLRTLNVQVEEYPRDKNATDGQLAVECALTQSPEALYLVGFLGGSRLDQALANVMLLTHLSIPTVLLDERNEARLLRGPAMHVWEPEPSEVISLIALTDEVSGIRTEGLRWSLQGETLRRGETRGISNEPSAGRAAVQLHDGLLLLTRHFV
jgi:thiamine pyrophosphokinase